MYTFNLYCLYYQNKLVGRILPENYGKGDFRTTYNQDNGLVSVYLNNSGICDFFWNQKESKLEVRKTKWEDGVMVSETLEKSLDLNDGKK